MQEGRLAKAEAKLSGWQRVLAWMHRQQQLGGFVEIATRNVETNLAFSTPVVIEDLDAAFVFHCVTDCNIRALGLSEARLEKGLLALCLNRFRNTTETPPEDWEIAAFRRALKVFVLKWMVFEQAIQIISDQYLSGMQALYEDCAEILKKGLEAAEIFLAGFNVKIAPRVGAEPITAYELAEYINIISGLRRRPPIFLSSCCSGRPLTTLGTSRTVPDALQHGQTALSEGRFSIHGVLHRKLRAASYQRGRNLLSPGG
jgi:hypothetical protein